MPDDNVVSIRDASIKTLSVSIHVMRIGTKQMTLSVLKQLQSAYIVGEDGSLRGVPWGLINYEYEKGSLQLIWQKGEELRRSPCDPEFELQWDFYNLTYWAHRDGSAAWARENCPVRVRRWTELFPTLQQLFVAV